MYYLVFTTYNTKAYYLNVLNMAFLTLSIWFPQHCSEIRNLMQNDDFDWLLGPLAFWWSLNVSIFITEICRIEQYNFYYSQINQLFRKDLRKDHSIQNPPRILPIGRFFIWVRRIEENCMEKQKNCQQIISQKRVSWILVNTIAVAEEHYKYWIEFPFLHRISPFGSYFSSTFPY